MSVATNVELVNLALDRLGVEPITALNDASPRAELMNRLYIPVLNSLLMETPWNFAMKRAKLVKNVTAPAFEYESAFDLPPDFLKVHRLFDYEPGSGAGIKHPYDYATGQTYFELEGDKILGNFDECFLVYISKITDVTKFSSDFVQAFYLRLAAEGSYKLTQDKALKNDLISEAEFYVRRAAAISAQQDYAEDDTFFFGSFIYPRNT